MAEENLGPAAGMDKKAAKKAEKARRKEEKRNRKLAKKEAKTPNIKNLTLCSVKHNRVLQGS